MNWYYFRKKSIPRFRSRIKIVLNTRRGQKTQIGTTQSIAKTYSVEGPLFLEFREHNTKHLSPKTNKWRKQKYFVQIKVYWTVEESQTDYLNRRRAKVFLLFHEAWVEPPWVLCRIPLPTPRDLFPWEVRPRSSLCFWTPAVTHWCFGLFLMALCCGSIRITWSICKYWIKRHRLNNLPRSTCR